MFSAPPTVETGSSPVVVDAMRGHSFLMTGSGGRQLHRGKPARRVRLQVRSAFGSWEFPFREQAWRPMVLSGMQGFRTRLMDIRICGGIQ